MLAKDAEEAEEGDEAEEKAKIASESWHVIFCEPRPAPFTEYRSN